MARLSATLVLLCLMNVGTFTSGKPSYNKESTFVTGGEEAEIGAWPWMASIRVSRELTLRGVNHCWHLEIFFRQHFLLGNSI